MATAVHGKRFAQTFNSVQLCAATAGLDIATDGVEVTTSCDAQKAFMQGKYGWTSSSAGPADFASGGADATIFTNVTGGGNVTISIEPDGPSSQSVTNPLYSGSSFTTSYSLAFDQANAVQYTAAFQGTGALTRATS